MTDNRDFPFYFGKVLGYVQIGEAIAKKKRSPGKGKGLDLANTRVGSLLAKLIKRPSLFFTPVMTAYDKLYRADAGFGCNSKIESYMAQLGSELPDVLDSKEQAQVILGIYSARNENSQEYIDSKNSKESTSEAHQLPLLGDNDDEI